MNAGFSMKIHVGKTTTSLLVYDNSGLGTLENGIIIEVSHDFKVKIWHYVGKNLTCANVSVGPIYAAQPMGLFSLN